MFCTFIIQDKELRNCANTFAGHAGGVVDRPFRALAGITFARPVDNALETKWRTLCNRGRQRRNIPTTTTAVIRVAYIVSHDKVVFSAAKLGRNL